ncbi:MAG: Uma2 family endonuclease, partial [Bernardetiaceae bacterium]|nr:Uma2 family endonuclease [Bernardetiaceae bacterium]
MQTTYSLKIPPAERWSDAFFESFCAENRDLRIERDTAGNILIMPPTYSDTGRKNSEIVRQLGNWNYETRFGYVFDSSTGFRLPNRAMRSPDAAVVGREKWDALSQTERNSFAPICPDFVIELRSHSDDAEQLTQKMYEWIANGAS